METLIVSLCLRTFDEQSNEIKSVYLSSDNFIMMQFLNSYQDGNKTKVSWINASEDMVKYVKTFNHDNKLIKSESFNPQGKFLSGSIHNWKNNGLIEEKGPIEKDQAFKPNAIYTYNENNEFSLLKEYDENDSIYAVVKWNYIKSDEFDNWIERQMITNDTINQIEKRTILYRKE